MDFSIWDEFGTASINDPPLPWSEDEGAFSVTPLPGIWDAFGTASINDPPLPWSEDEGALSARAKLEVVFEPGKIGMTVTLSNGLVKGVDSGEQASYKGVRVGMTFVSIQGEPYTQELLIAAVAANDNYRVIFAEAATLTVVFKPGSNGITAFWKSGQVKTVDERKQGHLLGVRFGMYLLTVAGEPYTRARYFTAKDGAESYEVTFAQEQLMRWDQEESLDSDDAALANTGLSMSRLAILQCSQCEQRFSSARKLGMHQRCAHAVQPEIEDLAKADECKSTSSSVSTAILSKATDVSTLPDVDADGRSSSTITSPSFDNCFNQPALTETVVEDSPEANVTASDSWNLATPTAEASNPVAEVAAESGKAASDPQKNKARQDKKKRKPHGKSASQSLPAPPAPPPVPSYPGYPPGGYLSPHAIHLPDFTRMDRTSALVDYVWYPKAGPTGMDLLIVKIKYGYTASQDTVETIDVLVEFARQEIHGDFVSIFDISEMALPSPFSMPWLLSLGKERGPEFPMFKQFQQSFAVIRGNSYLFNGLVDTLVICSGAETAPNFAADQAEALTMLNKLY